MIECEKGTELLLEYDPGMFRKVKVERIHQYGEKDRRIYVVGMTTTFK